MTFLPPPAPDELRASWAFSSLLTGSAPAYFGGFYLFGTTSSDFGAAVPLGSAQVSYAAHAFAVFDTADPIMDTEVTVSGVSINDQGVRTPGDSEVITLPAGSASGFYVETDKKWLGTVTFTRTAGPAIQGNFGYAKYWDSNNMDFDIRGLEVTGAAFQTDPTVNVQLRRHGTAGWTFNSGAEPTPPPPLATLQGNHGSDDGIVAGQEFAWKLDNLDEIVLGTQTEGVLWEINASVLNSIINGTVGFRYVCR